MKNRVIGVWVMVLSVIQLLVIEGVTIYQYSAGNYPVSVLGTAFDILSLIPIPAIFFLIGCYIRNN